MRGHLPEELELEFAKAYPMDPAKIFDSIYNRPFPNRFLSGFCRFADTHQKHDHINKIVKESFDIFFTNLVTRYPGHEALSFNCAGSVGFVFRDVLMEAATSHHMAIGKIIPSPIEDLVSYHLHNH